MDEIKFMVKILSITLKVLHYVYNKLFISYMDRHEGLSSLTILPK